MLGMLAKYWDGLGQDPGQTHLGQYFNDDKVSAGQYQMMDR